MALGQLRGPSWLAGRDPGYPNPVSIFAHAALDVCDGGHWLFVMKKSWWLGGRSNKIPRISSLARPRNPGTGQKRRHRARPVFPLSTFKGQLALYSRRRGGPLGNRRGVHMDAVFKVFPYALRSMFAT